MLLTISTTHEPATDLGYLLHKKPGRLQTFDLSFGQAHVFYTEAGPQRCTAALLLDVDPIGLVRNRRGPAGEGFSLEQYVNDRPYVASSFMSVAIAQVFSSALSGTSRERADLAKTPLPLHARISVLPCRGGEELLKRLFEPLGYAVEAVGHVLDDRHPEWGQSSYFTVTLTAVVTLQDLLAHLYVLMPVLDNDKHYWIGDEEVEKLMRHGQRWLATHPEKDQIVRRYLKRRGHLVRRAMEQLLEPDQQAIDEVEETHAREEEQVEQRISLNEQRLETVTAALKASGATRVLDLGCSYGNLLRRLHAERQFDVVVGVDVSHRALEIAAERLHLAQMSPKRRESIQLFQGALTYRDRRLAGYDAAAVVEVIEHLDVSRLVAFERVLFEFARPRVVIVTTPNVEYNVRFPSLPAGSFRHRDHRFEWSRLQFRDWAESVGRRFDYAVRFESIGPDDPEVGPPTQMALFERQLTSAHAEPAAADDLNSLAE